MESRHFSAVWKYGPHFMIQFLLPPFFPPSLTTPFPTNLSCSLLQLQPSYKGLLKHRKASKTVWKIAGKSPGPSWGMKRVWGAKTWEMWRRKRNRKVSSYQDLSAVEAVWKFPDFIWDLRQKKTNRVINVWFVQDCAGQGSGMFTEDIKPNFFCWLEYKTVLLFQNTISLHIYS